MKKFFINYWKSIAVVSCILYLSFASPSTFDGIPSFNNEDKLVHFLMYAGLCCMLIFDFRLARNNQNIKLPAGYLLCLVFPVLLGGTIEILQPMYFGRGGSWFDMTANVLGIASAWLFMNLFGDLVNRIFVRKKS